MERNEVAQNLKWRVEDIFPSDEAWEKIINQILYAPRQKIQRNQGKSHSFVVHVFFHPKSQNIVNLFYPIIAQQAISNKAQRL